MAEFKLISSDVVTFFVSEKIIRQSIVFNEMLDSNPNLTDIPINNVSSGVLKNVIEFCRNYENEVEPYISSRGHMAYLECPPQNDWSMIFMRELTYKELTALANASSYLQIDRLTDACCFHVASTLKDEEEEIARCSFIWVP